MRNIDLNASVQKLKVQLQKYHASDIATVFEDHEDHRMKIFQALGVKMFKHVFVLLDEDIQIEFFEELSKEQKQSMLKFLDTEDIKAFIDLHEVQKQILIISLLQEKTKNEIMQLFTYEVDSSGALSSPHFVNLPSTFTVKEATHYVTTEVTEKDELDVIFFHDQDDLYKGAIPLQELIIARANQSLEKLINDQYPFVYSDDPIELAIKKIRDYDIEIIPVLDHDHKQIGIILLDDALTIMDELHTETITSLVKAHTVSDTDSALKRSMNRLPWLVICALLNIVIVSALSGFSNVLETNIALILFQPLILGMAGNIGTQSIAVSILKLQNQPQLFKKDVFFELGIGFFNGLISGLLGGGFVYAFLYILPNTYTDMNLVALVVSLSIFISMVLSALFGVLTPMILRKFNLDEKAASGPLITTINDFFALGSYFVIAAIILLS
jgi:magnesium transporter